MRKALLATGLALVLTAGAASAAAPSGRITFNPVPGSSDPSSPASRLPLSDSTRVDGLLHVSGQIGNTEPGIPVVPGGIPAEARQTMDNVKAALARQGLGFNDVFKCTVFITDMAQLGDFNAVYTSYFAKNRLPARSAIGVAALTLGAHVEVECVAARP
ncbi:reactive intermediate/imine deaminase [Crossiella equi]|uniref:Reactive intermediate/imine deaminase n=1 Tax=Crossiella equi TaxID=130796 RepID=A0ABS5A6S6_9PSEU|nr:RidA family protein [Crossiella equi]MBP2472298.1 reactive intermediate/imine deaminase [Crossiella equi]